MARGALSENERHCLESGAKNQTERLQDAEKIVNGDCKSNGLRVRFLDEEGKTERTVSTDEIDFAVSRVKKIHILKNRSSSETSILLRNPSLMKRRSSDRRLSDIPTENINNNSTFENLNGHITNIKTIESESDKTESGAEKTKDTNSFKKNTNVYSVNQAKTLTPEKKKIPLAMPKLIGHRLHDNEHMKSTLPREVCLSDGATGKDFTARAIGRISKGLGRLLRRTNSVRISEPDTIYKVAYLGNVLTGWARGESCVEKPLSTLWRNYQQSTKPDVVMKLSVTNSGLKGFTKEHGLTEYWSHRITYCASPPHYPKLFCWVYRHEGKKLKHELRCHAVLCTKETVSKKITEELQVKLKQALVEFKKDRISKQNARLSLANSVYDNPTMPRRKILLSVGTTHYRPPLERSKSAPKLGAIEELCSEEDEEEAEMKEKNREANSWNTNLTQQSLDDFYSQDMGKRKPDATSPRKLSCPEGVMNRTRSESDAADVGVSDDLLNLIAEESRQSEVGMRDNINVDEKTRLPTLESIAESSELNDNATGDRKNMQMLSQSNFLVSDSDDGSVSSGCETASTVTSSDAEPTSLPSHFPSEELKTDQSESDEERVSVFQRIKSFERSSTRANYSESNDLENETLNSLSTEVNHIPIGEKNSFRRRSTYPPLRVDSILDNFEGKFESMIDNLADIDSLNYISDKELKNSGDNDSACSDESGYSELLDTGKDSIVGNTIMV